MGLLYTFFIAIYQLFLKLVALWHPKAKALVLGRRATWGILQNLPKTGHKRYWFHCASLGEYDMALPLIEACVAADPSVEIVVSFYSPSGMQHYHKRGFVPNAFACNQPLNTAWQHFIDLTTGDLMANPKIQRKGQRSDT